MRRWNLAFWTLVTWSVLATAGEADGRFMVVASVAATARLEALAEPGTIQVTERDLERGYVEFESTYRVRNNHPGGFLLHLHPLPGHEGSLSVITDEGEWRVNGSCMELLQDAALKPRELALRVRMDLDPAARTGSMPLPLRVAATPF